MSSSSKVRSPPAVTSPIGVSHHELPDLRSAHPGPLGETDGAVPDRTTVFDDAIPGVANSIQLSLLLCAKPQPTPRMKGSSFSSIVAGVRRRTRLNYYSRQS